MVLAALSLEEAKLDVGCNMGVDKPTVKHRSQLQVWVQVGRFSNHELPHLLSNGGTVWSQVFWKCPGLHTLVKQQSKTSEDQFKLVI